MIKPSELRIGNYLLASGSLTAGAIHVVTGIDANMIYFSNVALSPGNIAGIPLTEEWLRRCGFAFKKGLYYNGLRLRLQVTHWQPIETHLVVDTPFGSITIAFVHHLQNWFYALTGEELTIKP